MRLPLDVVIAREKLTDYLLILKSRNDKSKWLRKAGYSIENWAQLEYDLRTQVATGEAVLDETNTYGHVYRIETELVGPNGRQIKVVTIWMTEHATGMTKFITMYPG